MAALTSDAPVIASFYRHRKHLGRRLINYATALCAYLAYLAYIHFAHPGGQLAFYDKFHVFEWGLVFYSLYFFGTLYLAWRPRPYLDFTRDQLCFHAATGEPDPWWRDVKAIEEVGAGEGGKAVRILMKNGREHILDPRLIDFAGTDVAALARSCQTGAGEA